MNISLEQLGIGKEEILDRIVSAALGMAADYRQTGEESWTDIPLSEVVDNKITTAIGNLIDTIKPMIQARIEDITTKETEKIFNTTFQPVDHWNQPKGEPTTIRDMIAGEARSFWLSKVGPDGKIENSSYGSAKEERAVWYARKVMTDFYDKQLAVEVRKMAEEMKQKIPATISEEIAKTVLKYISK